MYMKAPKQKNAKHAKIEIKKIESQKKIINQAMQQWKRKQKQQEMIIILYTAYMEQQTTEV